MIVATTFHKATDSSDLFEPRDADFIVQSGYDVIADGASAFAVPRGSPEELIRCHLAAHKAYYGRYRSIDYVMKKYGKSLSVPEDYAEPIDLIYDGTSKIRSRVKAINRKGRSLRNLPDHFGLFAAGSALMRVEASFLAACVLCETRMGFEVYCLAKLILEQIAWAYAVCEIEDESLYTVKPSNCINRLKRLFPRVGKMYGFINEQAHMDPKTLNEFTRVRDDGILVALRSADKCLLGSLCLLRLADMYGAYMEVIYRMWYTTFEFITKRGSEPELRQRRRSLAEIKAFDTKVWRYLRRKGDQVFF